MTGAGGRRPPPAWVPGLAGAGIFGVLCLEAVRKFLTADPATPEGLGDFQHFYYAAEAIREGENPYAVHTRWYSYPPLLALLLTPPSLLPIGPAGAVWAVVNTAMTVAATLLFTREVARRFDAPRDRSTLLIVALGATLLVLDKVRSELRLGQTDVLVLLGYALALRWLGRRPVACGLSLAVAMNIKYQSLVFLPYLLARRRWAEALSMAAGSVLLLFAGLPVWGWQKNLEYLAWPLGGLLAVFGVTAKTETQPDLWPLDWHRSVSIPSTMARFADAAGLPAVAGWGVVVLLAGGVFALGWRLYASHGQRLLLGRGGREDDEPGPRAALVGLEWIGLIVALMAFSPQNTVRHMVQLLAFGALAVMLLVVWRPGMPKRALGVSLVLLALGLVLPPGGDAFAAAQLAWQSAGGPTWCMLLAFFVTLHAALRWIRGMPGASTGPTSA